MLVVRPGNGLSPHRRHVIIWTNNDALANGFLVTSVGEIWFKSSYDFYSRNYIWKYRLQTASHCLRIILTGWRHNRRDGVSNHQPHHCLLKRLFRRRSKKTSKLRVTGLCAGHSPVTGDFPVQMASNAENVSSWWRHHAFHMVWFGVMIRRRVVSHWPMSIKSPMCIPKFRSNDSSIIKSSQQNHKGNSTVCLRL